jgi:hypothetical protein
MKGVTCILDEQEKLKENVDGDEASQENGKRRKDNITLVLGEYNERMGKGWNLQKITSSWQTVLRIIM